MKKFCILLTICAVTQAAFAAWYWPFGGDEDAEQPRISEIMEPASLLIESASDLAAEGKVAEAVAEYKRALMELNRIELEHADRAQTPDFATLRNKRAYVNAAIDSLLLKQAKDHARAVAVTDTAELEKRYARKKRGESFAETAPKTDKTPTSAKPAVQSGAEKSKLHLAAADLRKGDYDAALLALEEFLFEKPNHAAALNLRAAVEAEMGDYHKAERTLDQSIQSNPKSYHAYYNMARLFLKTRGASGKNVAKLYYETGLQYGGPQDAELEAQLQ